MNTQNIRRDFLKYVSLNIFGQMAYSCYTMADTFFVSADLGTDGLTALNLAFPMFCLINGTGLMIGMGGGTRYAILQSREEPRRANLVFTCSAFMACIASALFVLLGCFFSEPLTRALGADPAVFSITHTYLKTMLLFAPAFLSNSLMQCFVRNDGNPSLSMKAMMTGSFSNILLDYFFIFPLGMGIFGAILATGLAPLISLAVLSPHFAGNKRGFHLLKTPVMARESSGIAANGIPALVTELSSGIVMFVFNFIILRLQGNTGVAAFGIVSVISLVVIAIYTGLSQGLQPVLSFHYGAGHRNEVVLLRRYAMTTMFLLSGLIYTVIFFQAPAIASIFNSEQDPLLQLLAIAGLKLYFLACPFIGFNIVTATFFTSTERPLPAQIISVSRGFLVLIPVSLLLSFLWKLDGVWCSYPLTECLVSLCSLYFLCRKPKN